MLEIEMKFAVRSFAELAERLRAWQAQAGPELAEEDHYFNAPDRDFARTDEAFRLRRIGTQNRATYKGPRQTGPAKTRTEIELGLEEGAEAAERFRRLVEHLGYRAVAVVRKRRIVYDVQRDGYNLQLCCDTVEEVGRFVELEIMAPPAEKDRAVAVVLRLAAELGLVEAERRSYLELLLTQRQAGAP